MANQYSPVVRQAAALATADMFTEARIQVIRNAVARNVPDDVFVAMIDLARRRGLDPLAKQIAAIQFKGNWQFIVTIDGYRSIAEQTQAYAGSDDPKFEMGDRKTGKGKPIPESATVTVYKMVEGQRCPFTATVYWDEYTTNLNNWETMPRTMLAKVAESHALRKAFPSVLSGTYTYEEMQQAGPQFSERDPALNAEFRHALRDAAHGTQQPRQHAHGQAPVVTSITAPEPVTEAPSDSQGTQKGEGLTPEQAAAWDRLDESATHSGFMFEPEHLGLILRARGLRQGINLKDPGDASAEMVDQLADDLRYVDMATQLWEWADEKMAQARARRALYPNDEDLAAADYKNY